MRIVFLSFLHGFGGAEKQNVALANELADRGHEVYLASLSVDNVCYQLSSKVNYIYLPDKTNGVLRLWHRYRGIRNILKQIQPDIVVNFWFQTAYMTALMPKQIVRRNVYAERGDPGADEYTGLLGLVRKVAFPKIDKFVFQSSGARNYFGDSIRKKSDIIMNPIFLNRATFPEVIKRRKVIVTVGRLHEQKNQKLLIQAFASIAPEMDDYTVEIYGEGPLEVELSKLIQGLGMQNRILLKGTSSEIHQKIYDASLFVLSSEYEGLPNTLLEAMALGIPCISTDCRPGGAREIICHEEDGLIVPLGDEKQLADAMLKMLQHPAEAEAMAHKASEKMKKFDKDTIYNQWEECFKGMVE